MKIEFELTSEEAGIAQAILIYIGLNSLEQQNSLAKNLFLDYCQKLSHKMSRTLRKARK